MFSTQFVCEFIEPPEPLKRNYYRCDKRFHLDAVKVLFEEKIEFGIMWITGEDMSAYIVKGTVCKCVGKMHVHRKGKSRKGGQSAPRFQRQADNLVSAWSKSLSEKMLDMFFDFTRGSAIVDGIVLCGVGPVKNDMEIPKELRDVIIGNESLVRVSDKECLDIYKRYVDKHNNGVGLKEVNRIMDELLLSDKVVYGLNEVRECIEECMLEELIYCGDMKGKLDLEKCRGYGCKLIESESVKLKNMGGVLGRRWY